MVVIQDLHEQDGCGIGSKEQEDGGDDLLCRLVCFVQERIYEIFK